MKSSAAPDPAPSASSRRQPWLLAVVFFILGGVLAAVWLHPAAPVHDGGKSAGELSDATKNVLAQLTVPVTIHYYSLLPVDSTDTSLPAFAARAGQLLAAMQAASDGKLLVVVIDTPAESNAAAASAEGLKVFNLEKGQASYLGLALASGPHREVFSRLQPEWEPALEYDVARALVRVAVPAAPTPVAPEIAQPAPQIVADIHRLIPDINATTVETADQIFHAEFMREIADAGTDMDARLTAAQEQVTQAQTSGSATDLEAAQKNLSQVQLTQGEKIRQIASNLKTRLAVFKELKSTNGTN